MSSISTFPRVNRYRKNAPNIPKCYNEPKQDDDNIYTGCTFNINTLPRGPYLQYKYNERYKEIKKIPLQDRFCTSTLSHMNNSRKCQIEKLKKEFLTLAKPAKRSNDVDKENEIINDVNYSTIVYYRNDDECHNENNKMHTRNSAKLKVPCDDSFNTKIAQFTIDSTDESTDGNKSDAILAEYNNGYQNVDYDSPKIKQYALNKIKQNCTKKQNSPNFIYLADIIKIKVNGLTQCEGWSLLCQSVQALQDLFISNTTSSTRVLPLIHPSSLRITSRGRVVFDIIPSCSVNSYICFVSPEYLNNLDKKNRFNESDIEKIWIYSLGITLRRAIRILPNLQRINTNDGVEYSDIESLDCIIRNMCSPNIHYRASLMYLLDVISQYCRFYHDKRPFSHIVMDLYREVIDKMNTDQTKVMKMQELSKNNVANTESNWEIASEYLQRNSSEDKLRVKRYPKNEININAQSEDRSNFIHRSNIGSSKENLRFNKKIEIETEPVALPVETRKKGFNKFIHRIDQFNIIGSSLPELSRSDKFPTHLNIRRSKQTSTECDDEQTISSASSTSNRQPEFIPNSSLSEEINLLLPTQPNHCAINVLTLNGRSYKIRCGSTTNTLQILESILSVEQLTENFYLGLCVLIGGDFVFLPSDMKIIKVATQILNRPKKSTFTDDSMINLFLRVKFFLPDLRNISTKSLHLTYLQLRKSVLEQQITCKDEDLIALGGLALQAEIGDYKPTMESKEYFTASYYLPEGAYPRHKEFFKYLRNAHFCKRGIHPQAAERQFIQYLQCMDEYGMHLYSAILIMDSEEHQDVYVGISMKGISISKRSLSPISEGANVRTLKRYKPYLHFDWVKIDNLCYSKHIFCVVASNSDAGKNKNKVKYRFKMSGRKSCFAFDLASEHHKFHIKIRDLNGSIKHIFNELNIPLTNSIMNTRNVSKEKVLSAKLKKIRLSPNVVCSNRGKKLTTGDQVNPFRFLGRTKSSISSLAKGDSTNRSAGNVNVLEENFQNEENEHPEQDISNESTGSSLKIISPNRNRVKMGTRVCSSRYLNKLNSDYDYFEEAYHDNKKPTKTISISSDSNDHMKISQLERNISEKAERTELKSSTDDEKSSQQSSRSKCYALSYDGHTCNSNEAYVINSSFGSATDNGYLSLQNESVSNTLLNKFIDMASTSNNFSDRIITRIAIVKDSLFDQNLQNERKQLGIQEKIPDNNDFKPKMTLGISIIQGSDQNIYVKDIVKNSPAERHGISIGDQLLAVNGISLMNLSYEESTSLLRHTGRIVELTVSQIYQNFENKLKPKPIEFESDDDSDIGPNSEPCKIITTSAGNFQMNEHKSMDELSRCYPNSKSYSNNKRCNIDIDHRLKTAKSLPNLSNVVQPHHSTILKSNKKFVGRTKYPVTPMKVASNNRGPN